jgi:hypothetical protein
VLLSREAPSPVTRALPPAPRTVRRRRGTLSVFLIGRVLTGPLIAAAFGALAFIVLEPMIFLLPAQPAHVIGMWRQFEARHGFAYYIQYQLDHTKFITRDEVLPAEFLAFHIGQEVKAHVLRFGPSRYSVLDRTFAAYARYRMIVWFCAAMGLAISLTLFHALWLCPWRTRRLVQSGRATYGAVIEKRCLYGSRRTVSCALTYQFKAYGVLRARCIRVAPQRFDSARLGDLVVIVFDPARPNRSVLYDYCDFVAV